LRELLIALPGCWERSLPCKGSFADAYSDKMQSRSARGHLQLSTVRILVIDDYEPWRRFIASTLQKRPELRVVGEGADGMEAVEKARELQPDLILLDVGLPKLNGIKAALRIRQSVPNARILFFTENSSQDIAEEAMRTGDGYIVKAAAAQELLPAVEAVLRGDKFVSTLLGGNNQPK
jgi:DNA-binding NarL/FixJ family response regulator